MKRGPWTKEEDEIIRDKYIEMGREIITLIPRSFSSIVRRAHFIGVCESQEIKLDDSEIPTTIEEYNKRNLDLIKSLSFRKHEEDFNTKIKLFY